LLIISFSFSNSITSFFILYLSIISRRYVHAISKSYLQSSSGSSGDCLQIYGFPGVGGSDSLFITKI